MQAGFLLGPAVIGRIQFFENWYNDWIMSLASQDVLGTLTMFGYSMFLFLVAVKMDASLLLKTGRKAFYTGIFSLMVPLIVGFSSELVGLSEGEKQFERGKRSAIWNQIPDIINLSDIISCDSFPPWPTPHPYFRTRTIRIVSSSSLRHANLDSHNNCESVTNQQERCGKVSLQARQFKFPSY